MTSIIAGGVAGLLLGIAAQRCGLTDRDHVTQAIALRQRSMTRCVLFGLGWGTILTAFLGWLAVIDVDMLTVLPLHGGTIVGAVIFGAAAGSTGLLSGTALTMVGGGRVGEGLCGVAGCLAGAAVMPWVARLSARVTALLPTTANTLFQVTLDEPFLFAGGFLGLGCIGAVLVALAIILRPEVVPEVEEKSADAPAATVAEPVSTEADDVREETVVVTLPGEEPVVVDTNDAEEPVDTEAEPATVDAQAEEAKPVETLAEEDSEPILLDHPDMDTPPEKPANWTESMAQLEEAAGMGTPTQEEAMPVGAKAVGEPERREQDGDEEDPAQEDQLG